MRAHALTSLVVIVTLAACGDDDEVRGTYDLVSVEGESLPSTVSANGESWLILEGSVRVSGDSIEETEDYAADDGQSGFHTYVQNAYGRDGNLLITAPEAEPDSDSSFPVCARGGVFQVEDDGAALRLVDIRQDGVCPSEPSEYDRLERVYRRN